MSISKKKYDEIRYMNGYYTWWKDFWSGDVKKYGLRNSNCAVYSRDLWWSVTDEWMESDENPDDRTNLHTTGAVYQAIGGYF